MVTRAGTWIAGTMLALAALLAAQARSAETDLTRARMALLKGRYEEAASQFTLLVETSPAGAIGLAQAHASTGNYDQAKRALDTAAQRFPASAAIIAELAIHAFEAGDYAAAERHKSSALALDPNLIPARWLQAELLKASGKTDDALRAYAWLVNYYSRAPRIDDPESLVYLARGIAEHARWTRSNNQFSRLVGDVLPAATRIEKEYWPARLETALLYLEKYNEPNAAAEITAGLALNPQAAELHAARAALALETFDLATAKTSLDRALEINPRLVWALQLRADWFFADVRPQDAIEVLQSALKINPRDERTLGRLLAAHLALTPSGRPAKDVEQIVHKVTSSNPHCGEFFLVAGDALDRMRRFPQAAKQYRTASERLPQLIAPRGQLGLVLMRLGQETEAQALLEESFAIDPFHVRIKNQLEVLELLQSYAVLETEHFVLKFDRGQDELLAKYAAKHLETTFADLTARLGYIPKDKTLVEIFSRQGNESGQNWFSARMVGLPLIGTVGACAGKMVALSSPTEMPNKYDWARVLRHELVHVINLEQTDFCVPHWFTEGLAVYLEDQPRPREWLELLARRSQAGTLFTLDDVTLGFVRPKQGDDWTLAYCQSELYIEHLIAKYGDDAARRMLAAYAEHLSTPQALERLFGVSQQQFEREYRQRIAELVQTAGGKIASPAQSLTQLQKQVADHPDDANALANLAVAWLERDDKPQARRLALAAQKIRPRHALAGYVLARLQLSIGDTSGAIDLLEKSLDESLPQEDVLALLALLKLKSNDTVVAERLYSLGNAKLPHSDRWLKGIVKIHLQSGDNGKLMPLLKRLFELEPDNGPVRQKLAELALAAKDNALAAELAQLGIHADVEDAGSHALLGQALAGLDRHREAAGEFQVALDLDGDKPEWLAGLAKTLIASGQQDVARDAVTRLRRAAADHPDLELLEKAVQP
jgi:tetratricopeptide (TPR) repeat protein